jgi:hypothetical protein
MQAFYRQLLAALREPVFHEGQWQLLAPRQAWPGNLSHGSFVAHGWTLGDERRLMVANLSSGRSQCLVQLEWPDLAGRTCDLVDLTSDAEYRREGDELLAQGLYLDMPGCAYHLFRVSPEGSV